MGFDPGCSVLDQAFFAASGCNPKCGSTWVEFCFQDSFFFIPLHPSNNHKTLIYNEVYR